MACLPYFRGITEPLTRLLRKNVVTRPHKTLQQEFPSPKFRPPIELQTNVVYKSPAPIVPRATLVRLEGVFQRGKRNTFEMS